MGTEEFDELLECHNALKLKIEKIGVYQPMFAHMPSDGTIPIYPMVAREVGQRTRAGSIVLDHLAAERATA